jgi:hypothetical protein
MLVGSWKEIDEIKRDEWLSRGLNIGWGPGNYPRGQLLSVANVVMRIICLLPT